MLKRARRRARGERGASLVEFALILPIFMTLILGMFTGGITYNRKIAMTNGVREAARFGATLPESSDWADDVVERALEVAGGDLQPGQVCAELVKVGTATPLRSSPSPCPSYVLSRRPGDPAGADADSCIVKVWARRPSTIELLFFSYDLNLSEPSTARYERDCP